MLLIKKKKNNKNCNKEYFGKDVENAIVEYNNSTNPIHRERLYNDKISYPFYKLVENIVHSFKFYKCDGDLSDLCNETISFLVMNMDKYDPMKGKAFSYFSIIAKNYLIQNNNSYYKKIKTHDLIDNYSENQDMLFFDVDEKKESDNEFIELFIRFWEENLTYIFTVKMDIMVADAIIELFRIRNNIDNFNKKALYIFIREMTGIKTQYITRVVNKMKIFYINLLKEYQKTGNIDLDNVSFDIELN